MEKFFRILAFTFESNMTIAQMQAALNQLGLWRFVERDSDFWGKYLSTAATRPGVANVKILEDGERYDVNVEYESSHDTATKDWSELLRELFDMMLPAIGARNIQETDSYERAGFE